MCERRYTSQIVADLHALAARPVAPFPRRSHLHSLFAQTAAAIAASPREAHKDMIDELLIEFGKAGVDSNVIEALECALAEVW